MNQISKERIAACTHDASQKYGWKRVFQIRPILPRSPAITTPYQEGLRAGYSRVSGRPNIFSSIGKHLRAAGADSGGEMFPGDDRHQRIEARQMQEALQKAAGTMTDVPRIVAAWKETWMPCQATWCAGSWGWSAGRTRRIPRDQAGGGTYRACLGCAVFSGSARMPAHRSACGAFSEAAAGTGRAPCPTNGNGFFHPMRQGPYWLKSGIRRHENE